MYYFLESVDLDFEHPEDFLVQQDFLSEVLSLEQQADFSFHCLDFLSVCNAILKAIQFS